MTEKIDPSKLELRAASPYRVVRFRKGLLIGAAALSAGLVMGVMMLALRKPNVHLFSKTQELYLPDKRPMPDSLSELPEDYSHIKTKDIVLDASLLGDFERPIKAQHHGIGGMRDGVEGGQRFDQQSVQAKQSGVFFRIGTTTQKTARAELSNPTNLEKTFQTEDKDSIYNLHALQTPASPYQVMAGSVIAASLITGINSDLPGLVVAQVTENVYDTVTGSILLIPQGARLIGSYDSVVAFGQSRALLVWQRIVMPNGSSITIDNLPAVDVEGYAGLEDEVDYHTWTLLKGIAVSTMLGVGTELSLGANESNLIRALRDSTQQNVSQTGQRITEKNFNVQPTITVRPGWLLRVILHKDLVLKPYRR